MFGRRGSRPAPVTDNGVTAVHAPELPAQGLDREMIISALRPERAVRARVLFSYLSNPPPLPLNYKARRPVCGFSARVVDIMLSRGLIAPINTPVDPPEVHTFLVEEERGEGGTRYRPIIWTRSLNARVRGKKGDRYTAEMPRMVSAAELRSWGGELMVNGAWTVTRDLRGAFFQIRLLETERTQLSFFVPPHLLPARERDAFPAGTWVAPTALPMGAVPSPELAHLFTGATALHPDFVIPSLSLFSFYPQCVLDVYVDNLRALCPTPDAARKLGEAWDRTAHKWGVVFKDEQENAAVTYTHLGAEFALQQPAPEIRVGAKTRRALRAFTPSSPMSLREWEALCGKLLFALRVRGTVLATVPLFLLFSRKVALALNHGLAPGVPLLLQPVFGRYFADLCSSAVLPVPVTAPVKVGASPPLGLVSDASLWGWGAVLCLAGGSVSGVGSRFRGAEARLVGRLGMVAAETLGLLFALRAMRAERASSALAVYVDNLAVLYAVKRGSFRGGAAAAAPLASYLKAIRAELGRFQGFTIQHVKSEVNPADPLSRNGDWKDVEDRLVRWGESAPELRRFMPQF